MFKNKIISKTSMLLFFFFHGFVMSLDLKHNFHSLWTYIYLLAFACFLLVLLFYAFSARLKIIIDDAFYWCFVL